MVLCVRCTVMYYYSYVRLYNHTHKGMCYLPQQISMNVKRICLYVTRMQHVKIHSETIIAHVSLVSWEMEQIVKVYIKFVTDTLLYRGQFSRRDFIL